MDANINDKKIDIILQHNGNATKSQNTEFFGFRVSKMFELLKDIKQEKKQIIELKFAEVIKTNRYKYIKLPRLKNTSTFKRGAGDILNIL